MDIVMRCGRRRAADTVGARVSRLPPYVVPWLRAVAVVWIVAFVAFATRPAVAGDAPITAFYGTYKGSAVADDGGDEPHTREMMVTIAPANGGFNVSWGTIKVYPDGDSKPKHYSIDFEGTKREQVFASQMRRNMFGDRVPLDPLSGDPFFWARIVDETLTIYALHILKNGSFEMQIYHRTLVEGGLEAEFIRFSETAPVRVVRGTLDRVSE